MSAMNESPTVSDRIQEVLPLLSAPAYFGPPVVFLLGPWLILVLLLIPPAAVLITFVLIVLLAGGLLAAVGLLIASPYLLVRHLRTRHALAPEVKRSLRPRLLHLTTK